MKDMFLNPSNAMFLGLVTAQTTGFPTETWERLGLSGIGIAATIYIWRHFSAKEAKAQEKRDTDEKAFRDKVIEDADLLRAEQKEREDANNAERNRLLVENNRLQQSIVDLNREQIALQERSQVALIQYQKDFLKATEDGQRSIKELLRKVRCPGAAASE